MAAVKTVGDEQLREIQRASGDEDCIMPEKVDAAVEKRTLFKMDLVIMPLIFIMYIFASIDRVNVGNARIAGMEKDLHMKGNDYNVVVSIYSIGYVLFEIPMNLVCKRIGPGWFIPLCLFAFGLLTTLSALIHNLNSLIGIRFVIGIFESSLLPSLAFYLSRWYNQHELTFRVSIFIIAAPIAGAFGGLLASAILRLNHFGGLHTWRMIFAIEGIATVGVALIALAIMPDRPGTALFLTAEEKELATRRLQAGTLNKEAPNKHINWKQVRLGMFNPVVIPTSFMLLFSAIAVQGASFFLPTIVRNIFPDKSVRYQQLLTVPPYAAAAIACALTCLWCWKTSQRNYALIGCSIPAIAGYVMFLASENLTVRYVAVFLPLLGVFTYGSLCTSHAAANVVSDTSKAAAIATTCMISHFGGLIASWAYIQSDSPNFRIGNGLNVATQSTSVILAVGTHVWMMRDNKRRDEAQRTTSTSEAENASSQSIDELDWKHPDFRWSK